MPEYPGGSWHSHSLGSTQQAPAALTKELSPAAGPEEHTGGDADTAQDVRPVSISFWQKGMVQATLKE